MPTKPRQDPEVTPASELAVEVSEDVPSRSERRSAKPPTRRTASFAALRKKKIRTAEVTIPTFDDSDEPVELVLKFRALSTTSYDDLVAGHPPNRVQKERGDQWDINTFAPALIAACSQEPRLSFEEAKELYDSDEWAGGEISSLFFACQRLCNAGVDVPFIGGV